MQIYLDKYFSFSLQLNIGLLFLLSYLIAFSILVISIKNPIHSILILIGVFFLGSIYLFLVYMEYFALLFLTVYVGAIVVLFLFMIMMLDIKMVNVIQKYNFKDIYSFRHFIGFFFFFEILYLLHQNFTSLDFQKDVTISFHLLEKNLYVDYANLLQRSTHLRGFGILLYTEYKLALLLATFLLLLAMIGSIAMLMEDAYPHKVKTQNPNSQSLKFSSIKK